MRLHSLFSAGLALCGCTAAQLQQVQTTLPTAIAAQGVVVRAAGGPIDLEAQQRLVVRGKTTEERQELVRDFRATRASRLAVTRTTIEAIAKSAAALGADLISLDADLARNDAQIDQHITMLATEGHPVTPAAPAPSSAPPPPPLAPAASPPAPAPSGG